MNEYMSIDKWMDTEIVVHIYSVIKKNTFESVLMSWMKLEPIIQSEISRRKRQILYINAYICNL